MVLSNPALAATVVGILTSVLVEVAKKVQSIPLNEGQTARLRMASLILSILGTIIVRLQDHTLADPNFIGMLVQSAATYFMSHLTYTSVIKSE